MVLLHETHFRLDNRWGRKKRRKFPFSYPSCNTRALTSVDILSCYAHPFSSSLCAYVASALMHSRWKIRACRWVHEVTCTYRTLGCTHASHVPHAGMYALVTRTTRWDVHTRHTYRDAEMYTRVTRTARWDVRTRHTYRTLRCTHVSLKWPSADTYLARSERSQRSSHHILYARKRNPSENLLAKKGSNSDYLCDYCTDNPGDYLYENYSCVSEPKSGLRFYYIWCARQSTALDMDHAVSTHSDQNTEQSSRHRPRYNVNWRKVIQTVENEPISQSILVVNIVRNRFEPTQRQLEWTN